MAPPIDDRLRDKTIARTLVGNVPARLVDSLIALEPDTIQPPLSGPGRPESVAAVFARRMVTQGSSNPVVVVPPAPSISYLPQLNPVPETTTAPNKLGRFNVANPVPGDTYFVTLTDSAGSRFAIDGTDRLALIPGGTPFNFTNATSHSITAVLNNQGGVVSAPLVLTINIADVNQPPTAITFEGTLQVHSGMTNGTKLATVRTVDDSPGPFTYSIASGPAGILKFARVQAPGQPAGVMEDQLQYAGGALTAPNTTYSFTFTVTDSQTPPLSYTTPTRIVTVGSPPAAGEVYAVNVDPIAGLATNPGTEQQPVQTFAQGIALLVADKDTPLAQRKMTMGIKRGSKLNERLIIPTELDGCRFGVYGPTNLGPVEFNRLRDITGLTWTQVSGQPRWQATVTGGDGNKGYVVFNGISGNRMALTEAAVTKDRDWIRVGQVITVYSPIGTAPPAYYTKIEDVPDTNGSGDIAIQCAADNATIKGPFVIKGFRGSVTNSGLSNLYQDIFTTACSTFSYRNTASGGSCKFERCDTSLSGNVDGAHGLYNQGANFTMECIDCNQHELGEDGAQQAQTGTGSLMIIAGSAPGKCRMTGQKPGSSTQAENHIDIKAGSVLTRNVFMHAEGSTNANCTHQGLALEMAIDNCCLNNNGSNTSSVNIQVREKQGWLRLTRSMLATRNASGNVGHNALVDSTGEKSLVAGNVFFTDQGSARSGLDLECGEHEVIHNSFLQRRGATEISVRLVNNNRATSLTGGASNGTGTNQPGFYYVGPEPTTPPGGPVALHRYRIICRGDGSTGHVPGSTADFVLDDTYIANNPAAQSPLVVGDTRKLIGQWKFLKSERRNADGSTNISGINTWAEFVVPQTWFDANNAGVAVTGTGYVAGTPGTPGTLDKTGLGFYPLARLAELAGNIFEGSTILLSLQDSRQLVKSNNTPYGKNAHHDMAVNATPNTDVVMRHSGPLNTDGTANASVLISEFLSDAAATAGTALNLTQGRIGGAGNVAAASNPTWTQWYTITAATVVGGWWVCDVVHPTFVTGQKVMFDAGITPTVDSFNVCDFIEVLSPMQIRFRALFGIADGTAMTGTLRCTDGRVTAAAEMRAVGQPQVPQNYTLPPEMMGGDNAGRTGTRIFGAVWAPGT